MGSQKYIARLDLNHLVFYKNWKSEFTMSADYYNTEKIDFNLPIRVFLTDRVNIYEIYSSKNDKANENKLYVEAQGGRKRPKKRLQQPRKLKHAQGKQKNRIEFPLTGPVGDLVVKGAFKVIIHQDTDDDPEFDDSHLLHAYSHGKIVSQSDVVFLANPSRTLWNEREGLFNCIMLLSAGKLTLSCVFFNVSRSVTVVGVKWLHDATEITGGLFLSSFKDHKSALFETPKGKAIKVTRGQLIPLLRSTFVVIDGSTFNFDANVASAHGGSLSVINSITFNNDDFSEVNNFTNSRVIGGKIEVEVTMKPN